MGAEPLTAAEFMAYELWRYNKPNSNAVQSARENLDRAIMALRAGGFTIVPPPEADGVWAAYGHDQGPYLISTRPTETEALRDAVSNYGYVVFLPFGKSLAEAVREDDARKRAVPTGSERADA